MGRLRFELRTSRLKAGCSTAELATQALGACNCTIGSYHAGHQGKTLHLFFQVILLGVDPENEPNA